MKPVVQFFFLEQVSSLQNRIRLKQFIPTIFKREKKQLDGLNYIFCSDEYLLEINRTYLRHDYFTDIITFDLSTPGSGISGEIYISIDRVRENAKLAGTSIKEEIHRVIFHGALHLCGFKDKAKEDKSRMTQKEDEYLKRYFK